MTNDDMESFIRAAFEENFERLRFESGHALSPAVKETALQQVLLYWRKLRDVAESITDTEVRLNLPCQRTPAGREFGIEGIVDIVREDDRVVMYDVKTHDPDFVRANRALYEKQLNVYAHIWEHLRGERLDETAIIATPYPESVRQALLRDDAVALERAMANWEPVVPIPCDAGQVAETVRAFGSAVDGIEEGRFAPAPASRLKRREFRNDTFATRVCRNCDARFSCDSYRQHAPAPGQRDAAAFRRYYDDDFATDEEREAWRDSVVPDSPAMPE